MTWPQNLSLNLQTTIPRPLEESLAACADAGVPAVGLYSPPHVDPIGIDRAVELVRQYGVPALIYASAGCWGTGFDSTGKPRDLAGNIEILDHTVRLGCDMIGVSCGGLPAGSKDIRGTRRRIAEGLAELAPYAAERNVTLAIEPVHPIYGPDRAVVHTLHQALDLAEEVAHPSVGVVVDTYHQWWEPDLLEQLQRGVALGLVSIVQVSDWSPEKARSKPFSRVAMGDGCIDFDIFTEGLKGYTGWYDMEVLACDQLIEMPVSEVLRTVAESFERTMGSVITETSPKRVRG